MLRIMTYNTHHSAGNDVCEDPAIPEGQIPEPDCSLNLERVADVIASEHPDIVGLQEVDRFWARSGGVDQPEEFGKLLRMEVRYGANLDHQADSHADVEHEYGLATLSRYPISGWEHLFLPTVEGWEQRGMLDTRIDVPGIGEIAVINTHLQVGGSGEVEEASWQRVGQSRAIADHIATLDIPVIVLGDFNCEADSGDIDPLMGPDSGLTDVWSAAAGPGKTFFDGASGEHVARIDYVLVSHHFSVETAEVIDKERSCLASDHFPLVAELRFVGSAVPDNLS